MKKRIKNIEYQILEDENIMVFGRPFNLISIYDDRVYDRSDADIMNTSMRNYLKDHLSKLKYDWVSGNVLSSPLYRTNFIFPKNKILGASPFDAILFEKRDEDDFFVLTPTQVASFLIKTKSGNELLEYLEKLISKHPINLDKMKDHFNSSGIIKLNFNSLYSQLKKYQDKVIKTDKLKRKSRIGRII